MSSIASARQAASCFSTPAAVQSHGTKPIFSAGDSGSSRQSPCSGSRNSGSPTREAQSCPSARHVSSGFPKKALDEMPPVHQYRLPSITRSVTLPPFTPPRMTCEAEFVHQNTLLVTVIVVWSSTRERHTPERSNVAKMLLANVLSLP